MSKELAEARRLLKWAGPLFEAQDGVSVEAAKEVDAYRHFMTARAEKAGGA